LEQFSAAACQNARSNLHAVIQVGMIQDLHH